MLDPSFLRDLNLFESSAATNVVGGATLGGILAVIATLIWRLVDRILSHRERMAEIANEQRVIENDGRRLDNQLRFPDFLGFRLEVTKKEAEVTAELEKRSRQQFEFVRARLAWFYRPAAETKPVGFVQRTDGNSEKNECPK